MNAEKMMVANRVTAMVKEIGGPEMFGIYCRKVVGNNGREGIGIQMNAKEGCNTAPVIYIEKYLDDVMEGRKTEREMAEEIFGLIKENDAIFNTVNEFVDRDYIMAKCVTKVLSAERNAGMLENTPYRMICDLAEVVIVEVGEDKFFTVTNQIVEWSGIDVDELFEAARKNTADGVIFNSLGGVLGNMGVDAGNDDTLYLLTTRGFVYGAAVIGCKDVLEKCKDDIGDFYIIPSSVHEVLLLRKGDASPEDVVKVIGEVNQTVVSDEDFLSDRLYEMKEDGSIAIAA